MTQNPVILIAASGTGGHLFPALYIARAIRAQHPSAKIVFLGAGRPLEADILGRGEFELKAIKMVGVNKRGVRGIVELLTVLPSAVLGVWRLFRELQPSAVVGVGGYASVLPVVYAALRRIPTWIHEAEPKPGLANGLLAPIAGTVSLAYRGAQMSRRAHTVFTGHPVRPELLAVRTHVPEGEPLSRLLVMGGSQGAEGIDRAMCALAPRLRAHFGERGLQVVHQCRKGNVTAVNDAYRGQLEAEVLPFIEDLPAKYQWAHVIISRAGAGTVTELGIVNRPAILVPFPLKEIHQHENARVLSDQGKALLVEEGGGFEDRLFEAIRALFTVAEHQRMQALPCQERVTNAAETIARGVLAMVSKE